MNQINYRPDIYVGDHFIFRDYKWKVIGLSDDLSKAALSRIDLSDRFENVEIESLLKTAVRVNPPPTIIWYKEGAIGLMASVMVGLTICFAFLIRFEQVKSDHEQEMSNIRKKHRLELWEADKRFLKSYEWGIIEDGETIDIVEGEGVKVERIGDKLHVTINDNTTVSTTGGKTK